MLLSDVNTSNLRTSWLKYYYTKNRLYLVSTSITGASVAGSTVTVTGVGTVTKITGGVNETISGCPFTATITDSSPDAMGIEIHKPDGVLYHSASSKAISSGNQNVIRRRGFNL